MTKTEQLERLLYLLQYNRCGDRAQTQDALRRVDQLRTEIYRESRAERGGYGCHVLGGVTGSAGKERS